MTQSDNKAWLSIIGIGEDGIAGLSKSACVAIDTAEIFVGGKRHLAMLGNDKRPQMTWDSPLLKTIDKIRTLKNKQVCVLATGDPMCFGIGETLIREFGPQHCRVIAHQSAFSMACARLGWSMAEVDTLTLHGRPLSMVNSYLRPHAKLLILSADGNTPKQLAQALKTSGYGQSLMTVLEHMGGPKEKRFEGVAKSWRRKNCDLNTIAVHCIPDPGLPAHTRLAGLPDELYQQDGMLSKQDVRAITLAAIAPAPGQLLWDVGAGAGSIAIEYLRAEPTARAIAIERNTQRMALIAANAENLGVPQLQIVQGEAPEVLKSLEKPQVIFIGGGVSNAKILRYCWRVLPKGGRLIANAVTMEGQTCLYDFMKRQGGQLSQVSISKMTAMGNLHAWRAMATVIQYKGMKS